jgi:hypothetical protein
LRALYQLALLVAVMALDWLAFCGWVRRLRSTLEWWRNMVVATSFLITLSALLLFITPVIARLIGFRTFLSFGDEWFGTILILTLIATVLACGLKGASRIQSVAANLLLLLLWWSGMVY